MTLRAPLLTLLALLVAAPASAAQAPETVVMDLDAFLSLYDASKPKPTEPKTPVSPHQVTLPSADYSGTVVFDGDEPISAVVRGSIDVQVLHNPGWVSIPLLPDTVALRSATIAGAPAALVRAPEHGNWLTLVTQRTGAFTIEVEFAASVFSSEGRTSFSFPVAPSAATSLSLAVPVDEDLDFTVGGARLQSDRVVGATRVVEALIPSSHGVSVTWQREIPDVVESVDARLYAEVFSLVGIGDGLLSTRATIAWTIQQAGTESLRVQLPDDVALVDVSGTGIRNWAVEDGVLTVTLNFAAEGSYRLSMVLERPLGEGKVAASAPLVQPLGVERSKGWVGVEARGALEISAGDAKGVVPVDVRALPGAILGATSNPVLLGYKYLGGDVALPLQITAHEDVAVLVTLLDTARATTMFTPDGRRLTAVTWRVRNNRKQFLRLTMPANAELWSASVAGQAVQPARAADGRILIPLVRSQESGGALAGFDVGVVYVEEGAGPDAAGKGSFRAALPTADVPITWVGWTVYAPSQAKVLRKSLDGSLRSTEGLRGPYGQGQVQSLGNVSNAQSQAVHGGRDGQIATGGLGQGATPVTVSVPVEGQPLHFEKLLALGEELWVGFEFKGLKK